MENGELLQLKMENDCKCDLSLPGSRGILVFDIILIIKFYCQNLNSKPTLSQARVTT